MVCSVEQHACTLSTLESFCYRSSNISGNVIKYIFNKECQWLLVFRNVCVHFVGCHLSRRMALTHFFGQDSVFRKTTKNIYRVLCVWFLILLHRRRIGQKIRTGGTKFLRPLEPCWYN